MGSSMGQISPAQAGCGAWAPALQSKAGFDTKGTTARKGRAPWWQSPVLQSACWVDGTERLKSMQWQQRAPSFCSPHFLSLTPLIVIICETVHILPWALQPEVKTESKPKGVDTPFCQRSNTFLFKKEKEEKKKIQFYFHDDGCHRKHFPTKHHSQDFISLAVYSGGAINTF